MDLDFSFALVSSLTPRSQPSKTALTENNKLSSKSRKIKTKKHNSPQFIITKSTQQEESNKENHPLEEQLMTKDECFLQNKFPYFDNTCIGKESLNYPVDMTNIAVRSNKSSRDRKKKPPSITHEISSYRGLYDNERALDSCNIANTSGTHIIKKGRKRKSAQGNAINKTPDMTDSSVDFVESPCSGTKALSLEISKRLSIDSSLTRPHVKSPQRVNGLNETSLSTAYDSGSFRTTRRRGAKVISETPESEESSKNNLSRKKKCSLDSTLSHFGKCKYIGETSKFLSCSSSSLKADSPKDKQLTQSNTISNQGKQEENKLSSTNIYSLTDALEIRSSLELNTNTDKKEQKIERLLENIESKKSTRKLVMSSPVNEKEVDGTRSKQLRNNKTAKSHVEFRNKKDKKSKERSNDKRSINSTDFENCSIVPPTEVIPKFEHINNWLKETQESSIIVLSSDSSFNSPQQNQKATKKKSKGLKSLSPRIKRKIQKAQTALQEEQQLFEELYGSDIVKRLSDEVEDNFSIESTRESLEISEKVLEKIYGTVWKNDEVLPKSEPRRGRPKNSSKKKAPKTERKKHRTSIYDVFSSSSSEDRFEEFLENVHRGKIKSTHRLNKQPDNADFINDSDSDVETSFTYYQSILSSAVKEDIENLRSPKVNRRRLSFASSQEECSESVKSDLKNKEKDKKITSKKDDPKPRSKKGGRGSENKANDDVNGFTLVTPIKVKDKNTDDQLDVRIKHIIANEVPKSIGKSRTPKNKFNKENKTNTEEKLREKYLNGDNFKVPKHPNSLKTPNKPSKPNVPSSPALSFLSSLSEITAGLPCHPDALVYKKNFKEKREELAKKLFSLYNREVFDNQLPENMQIEWSTRMTSTSGFCYNKRMYSNNQIFRSSRVVLSTKILDRADRLRDTLIHELCHAATWIINATSDGHGPKWKAWADKANRRFPELPVIKRCHDYAISTKFTYKCMSCGYCIGRHSKSLNTDRKRCGFCFGKFQVFVTTKMSTASVTSGSDSVKTQRNPSGFALFVKENYAAVKKENNVPHGQVMKLLSQKFAEVKISKQKEKEP